MRFTMIVVLAYLIGSALINSDFDLDLKKIMKDATKIEIWNDEMSNQNTWEEVPEFPKIIPAFFHGVVYDPVTLELFIWNRPLLIFQNITPVISFGLTILELIN